MNKMEVQIFFPLYIEDSRGKCNFYFLLFLKMIPVSGFTVVLCVSFLVIGDVVMTFFVVGGRLYPRINK